MFAADFKILNQIQPVMRRVLIVDPNPASARLLLDILKGLGGREIIVEADEHRALEHARELEPGLIFTERSGPRLDGEQLARKIRRSSMVCREVPIIMMTAEATASSIKGARDAGIHEFLRKPFTAADLLRRVQNVALKPREWIEAVGYVGPDRRRFNSGEYAGPQKRKADKPASAEATILAVKDQAMRILAASLAQFDSDPMQAVRAITQQAMKLKALAIETSNAGLATSVAGLDVVLASGRATRMNLSGPVEAILALAEPETQLKRTG